MKAFAEDKRYHFGKLAVRAVVKRKLELHQKYAIDSSNLEFEELLTFLNQPIAELVLDVLVLLRVWVVLNR